MAIKKLTDQVYQISLGIVNCFVIDDNGLTLVDTGLPDSKEKIFKALADIGKKGSDIKQIILTHLHKDHAGSAAKLQTQFNIPVYAHAIDAALLKRGIGVREPMIRTPGFISWMVVNVLMRDKNSNIEPVNPIIELEHDQILPILSGARVIHSPGHSAGHIALLLEKEGLLIAGDICANVAGLAFSPLYEDVDLGKETLKKVSRYHFDKACFGHGNPVNENANKKIAEKFK